jgi:hypothetical protein
VQEQQRRAGTAGEQFHLGIGDGYAGLVSALRGGHLMYPNSMVLPVRKLIADAGNSDCALQGGDALILVQKPDLVKLN